MKIQKVDVSKISPSLYNPRLALKSGDPDYEKLRASIHTFGYVEPLVWNERTGTLVSGHQRLSVLIEDGVTEVEVSVVDLPLEKEKALNLALNKIRGDWDEDKLADLLEELSKVPDIDMNITGFSAPEISEILDRVEEVREDEFNVEEELKKIDKAITKKDDLIILGNHRLLCGDSAKPEDIARLIGDKKINLLFSDPPYGISYLEDNRPTPEKARTKPCRKWQKIHNDNLPQEEYEAWLKNILVNITPYIGSGAPMYIFNGSKQFGPMYTMLGELGFHVSCVITWAKESFALGYGDYQQQTEFCLYCWKEDNGAHKWYGPNNETTLWQVKRDPTSSYFHPTQKPVALPHRAIKNSSKRGDVVLDVFIGVGGTLIAADGLNRVCYGMEMDPVYCDVIVKRYIKFVGEDNVAEDIRNKYIGKEGENNE